MNVLVTGGAGFVGANIAVALAERRPEWRIVALDNLSRPGSELNLPRLRSAGVEFVRGDVRVQSDLGRAGEVDCLVECAAEPSVLAGVDGAADYVVATNLLGAHNCLELARRQQAAFVFLSTSRVYPVARLRELELEETETRFELAVSQLVPGASAAGISEAFPLEGSRTLYGATKLAAELLVVEYAASFGLRAVVDRCGVIAGPWQMGKVDQGVVAHWLLAHYFDRPLRYLGYGGSGKQVRDVLHVADLIELVEHQIEAPDEWNGRTVNVGGGRGSSISLAELTELCREATGHTVRVEAAPGSERPGDVPLYVSDNARLYGMTDWRPERGPENIVADLVDWVRGNERAVKDALSLA